MRHWTIFLRAVILVAIAVPIADAHFKLLEPQSWLVEDAKGDPQKMAPCGGTPADAGTPSNILNKVRGGQKLHIKIEETVFHPGHYRFALARSRAALPPDPDVQTVPSERGPRAVSADIQNPITAPVLADGLFVHTAKPTGLFETDLDIPNINCEKCVLQIIQFMAGGVKREGNGDHSYHHCADLQITADPAKSIDSRW